MPETPYVETEALIAVMCDDIDKARRILREFYPSELSRLAEHAVQLASLCHEVTRWQVDG